MQYCNNNSQAIDYQTVILLVRSIAYTYNATGIKLSKEAIVNGSSNTTEYIGNFIYEGSTTQKLKYILHPEGRIVINRDGSGDITDYEYQYTIKDHLGNTRVTWTSNMQADTLTATMETENQGTESNYFGNVTPWISAAYNTTTGGNEVIKLNSSSNVGATFTAQVFPGDTIRLDVNAGYQSGSSYSSVNNLAAMIAAIATGFGGVQGGGEAGMIYDAIDGALSTLGLGGSQGSTKPAAYLNYLVFDKSLQYQFDGYVNTAGASAGTMDNFSMGPIAITKPGYIYVYLSFECTTTDYAFFDDLNVEIRRSVIQADDYYPFGLTMSSSSYQREDEQPNAFLYNGKELQTDLNLDWYDYGARMYDAAVGRFFTQDRFSEKYLDFSPYQYAANDPVKYIDYNGDSIWISWTTGRGKNATSHRVLYSDNNIYNEDGSEYDGDNSFVWAAYNDLNTLTQGKTGNKIVSDLQSSGFNYSIEESNSDNDNTNSGSQNTTLYNPNSTGPGGLDTNGSNNRSAYIGLGHELAHAWDWDRARNNRSGLPDNQSTNIASMQNAQISNMERFAVHVENMIRSEHGLALRTTYGKTAGQYPMLQKDNKSSLYYRLHGQVNNGRLIFSIIDYRDPRGGVPYRYGSNVGY